jgi:hypothetical protein
MLHPEGLPPTPYAIYKGIELYLYQDDTMQDNQYGGCFNWYGRLQNVEVEEYEQPTLVNIIQAAQDAIDLLLAVKEQGLVDDKGMLKSKDVE